MTFITNAVHRRGRWPSGAVLAILLAASACSSDSDDTNPLIGECDANLLPGDLVITEVMANPSGADDGNEWFEFFYGGNQSIDLSGVTLAVSRASGDSANFHTIEGLTIEPGQYLVVGDQINDELVRLEYVDYGYANDLRSLGNTDGLVSLLCGTAVLDEAAYSEPSDSVSRSFDGGRAPDASANDDEANWCDASTTFSEDVVGTPGSANDPCAGASSPTSCIDGGTAREIVPPGPGDLVITEFMPNPSAVGDDAGEWLEVYVAASVDLNGLELGASVEDGPRQTLASNECLRAEAGSYLVFARQDDPTLNGGLPGVDQPLEFSLSNSNTGVFIGHGGAVVDAVGYSSASDGAATSLDPRFINPDDNDNPDRFCAAVDPYGDGDLGTPGSENPQCDLPPPDGQCWDGRAYRDIEPPSVGDVVITEFMANPDAVGDGDGEWFEILANGAFDLNGLELGTEPGEIRQAIDTLDCIRLGAGDYALFARSEDAATNGGLPSVDVVFDFSLINASGQLLVGHNGQVLDEITYTATSNGAATGLAPDLTSPADNDDEGNWCPSTASYGAGDLGTPGAENSACDGGSTPGTCLDGDARREPVAPGLGDLVITEYMANPTGTDGDLEWFEVLVNRDVDLNGLQLGRNSGDVEEALPAGGPCLSVEAGERVVFAHTTDPAVNGNLPSVIGTFDFALTQSNAGLWVGIDNVIIDDITYTTTIVEGASASLDPSLENATDNDDEMNFCLSTSEYAPDNRGTPGAPGDPCEIVVSGTCNDGGTSRPIVPPAAGGIIITELMVSPSGADADREWFEVYVDNPVDLNGLQLSELNNAGEWDLEQTLQSDDCLAIPAETYVLFVRNRNTADNGGLPEASDSVYVADLDFSLVAGDRGLAVGVGDVRLDEVTWSAVNIDEGEARSFAGALDDPTANDDEANWCDAGTPYGDGDLGTPAAGNDSCD